MNVTGAAKLPRNESSAKSPGRNRNAAGNGVNDPQLSSGGGTLSYTSQKAYMPPPVCCSTCFGVCGLTADRSRGRGGAGIRARGEQPVEFLAPHRPLAAAGFPRLGVAGVRIPPGGRPVGVADQPEPDRHPDRRGDPNVGDTETPGGRARVPRRSSRRSPGRCSSLPSGAVRPCRAGSTRSSGTGAGSPRCGPSSTSSPRPAPEPASHPRRSSDSGGPTTWPVVSSSSWKAYLCWQCEQVTTFQTVPRAVATHRVATGIYRYKHAYTSPPPPPNLLLTRASED